MYQSRSLTSLASRASRVSGAPTITHSVHSAKGIVREPKWWQRRPILHTAWITDLQKGSYYAAIYTLIQSLIQIMLAVFDTYCLIEARPGSRHFRTFGFSFLFVYAGNQHIRRTLIASCVILFASATYLFISSIILMSALKKESEVRFRHWLQSMAIFILVRTFFLLFSSLVNDLYFGYHQAMLIFWTLCIALNVFAFLVVVSNYQELSNITKLEDMAKLKMSTLSSLNASRSLSHHSLDSYSKGLYAGISVAPDGRNVSRPGSTTGSLASFNMAAGTASINTYGSIGPGTLGIRGGGGTPSTASSIPLSAFGLNLNPTGIFTMEQLTGSSTSLNRSTANISTVPDGGGRGTNVATSRTSSGTTTGSAFGTSGGTNSGLVGISTHSAFGTSSGYGVGTLGQGSAFDRPAPGPSTTSGQLRQLQVKTLPSPISVQRPSNSFFSRISTIGSSGSRTASTSSKPLAPSSSGSKPNEPFSSQSRSSDQQPRTTSGSSERKIYGTSTII